MQGEYRDQAPSSTTEHGSKVVEHGGKVAEHSGKVAEHGGKVAEHGGKVAEHGTKVVEGGTKVVEGATKIVGGGTKTVVGGRKTKVVFAPVLRILHAYEISYMALRDQPWRSLLAAACAVAAGMSGQIAVDRYHERSDYMAPTILVVVGLAFAWRAIRSRIRWDRILGYPVFGLLALIIVFMIFDRAG